MLLQKMRVMLFLLYIGFGLTACGNFTSDSGGDDLPDATIDKVNPEVTNRFPESDTTGIEIDSVVRFTFSELMDIKSFEDDRSVPDEISLGIRLYSGKAEGDRVLSSEDQRPYSIEYGTQLGVGIDPVTGNKIDIDVTTFTLRHESGRFALNTEYTTFVSENVQDLAGDDVTNKGNKLGDKEILSFITEDGEWESGDYISFLKEITVDEGAEKITKTVEANQYEPSLASNAIGDVLAIWRQNNSEGGNDVTGIWASRYSPNDEQWILSDSSIESSVNVQRLDQQGLLSNAFGPKITINDQGKAVAVWYQSPESSTIDSIWVNIFERGKWQGAQTISDNQAGSRASSPEVIIDENGDITVVWLEPEGSDYRIKTNFYNAETENWLIAPYVINHGLNGDAKQPSLSLSLNGSAMVVWVQEVSGLSEVYGTRYSNGSWESPSNISKANSSVSNPIINMDKNGDAFSIWEQYDGIRDNIWLSRYSGGIWSDALLLEVDNRGDSVDPSVIFGPKDEAFAVWVQRGEFGDEIIVRQFTENKVWGEVEEIASSKEISKPLIRFDFEGNAMAVWVDGVDTGHMFSNRYSKLTSSWAGEAKIELLNNEGQSLLLAPLIQDGRFISVWSHFDGDSFSLVAALFSD